MHLSTKVCVYVIAEQYITRQVLQAHECVAADVTGHHTLVDGVICTLLRGHHDVDDDAYDACQAQAAHKRPEGLVLLGASATVRHVCAIELLKPSASLQAHEPLQTACGAKQMLVVWHCCRAWSESSWAPMSPYERPSTTCLIIS
jgi:hypothetical protein